ncbi:MAG TPA: GAF domain-containing protein [Segetibacter sp.]|jgi:PAS domain-containing protein
MDNRLQAVKQYLDLPFTDQKDLEDLVYLASEICQTPIASITFVDDKKQYPVIGVGNTVESSCEISFCNHTIKQDVILEITDAQNDPRFINNPLVTGDPYIRFYAGVPLVTLDGFTIGSLCVIDQQPKKLTEKQVKGLEILCKQVMHCLEIQRNIEILKDGISAVEQNKELLDQAEIMKKAFYDGCEDLFILLNNNFEIVSYNSSTQNFFTLNGREIKKGKNIVEYLMPENARLVEEMLYKAKAGEAATFEILSNANTNVQSWNKFTVSPTYNSKQQLIGLACIGCNIDEDKMLHEKISLQKSTLSQIAQLHSHQIRHPLTNILGIINLLKQDDFKMTEQYLTYLESASNELDDVIRKVVIDSHQAA